MGLVNHFGPKEDAQENFLEIELVHNPDEVRYNEMKIYMHKSYVNGKNIWPKTLSDALPVLVNWKGG